jgi:hypothetical protein
VVNFTPRPHYPRGKSPRYPLDRRLGGPQSRSGRFGEEKILDPTGTGQWSLQKKNDIRGLFLVNLSVYHQNGLNKHCRLIYGAYLTHHIYFKFGLIMMQFNSLSVPCKCAFSDNGIQCLKYDTNYYNSTD